MPRKKKIVIENMSPLADFDVFLFKQGTHARLYEKLGSHTVTINGTKGTRFAVWAPNAKRISVIGDFNDWKSDVHQLQPRWDESGIWEGFIPGIGEGTIYKYHIVSQYGKYQVDKGDPFSFFREVAPQTASIVYNLNYSWHDTQWMKKRGQVHALDKPMAIYEVHLGSWRRSLEEKNRMLTYRELAPLLAEYVKKMGFTHVEFLPIMEHPFYGSWGYQTIGYFAPTSRYGTPQDFMYLVDYLHQHDIGIILDWVCSHFPSDEPGLVYFDGTHLYEHADPKQGFHPDWRSYIFNYGRNEVKSFLISSAQFWLDQYHVDGLRIDAVASMLYCDYSRKEGEWIPNIHGGRENLDAIDFIKKLNESIYREYPDVHTIAEESTAWPMVSRPTYLGGLGFGMKWNMGWMHDTLDYFSQDPVYRKHHHNQLTFSIWYLFFENFILSLSHDEVVYGKGSLIEKMAGDEWQKFANLRALFSYMYAHPGKKVLFMGGEFGQRREWNHEDSLDWHLLEDPKHHGIQKLVRDLNQLYRNEPALHELDFESSGFEWIDARDWEKSIISFLRKSKSSNNSIFIVSNLTPVPRHAYRIGIPYAGFWKEIFNSDAEEYGGSGQGNFGGVEAKKIPSHGRPYSLKLTLPPLSVLFFKREGTQK
ncbi:glycogen branching protein [candidate division TA06 bacterium DG_78]|uniref:1,4-alpha-glucan branching enzyme GlgB n=1 Tax=candidate division TA06 bacterium DG_78 TaxID=1703772 RepID=A0A0S7YBG5_UNCT6|nr:MAG: glycogen branching protein [candidate division TA06 bacterium DG_78]